MGFYLADAGFDVWVANSRCNSYSAGNREYRSTDAGYWQSSLDELALLDLPATIDAVLRMTGAPQLSVVGHSQGAALPAMLLAARPEYNKKVGLVVMLAPVMFAEELKTKFLTSQARKGGASLLADAGIGHFLPSTMMAHLLQGCMRSHQSKAWCFNLVNFFLFGPSSRVADDDFARLAAAWPSGMPLRVIMHWSQMHRSGRGLEMFDYGSVCDGPSVHGPYQETCNQAKYGQEVPPLYDISRVTTKAAVMYGADDLLGTEANVAKLLANWRADVVFTRKYLNTA
ncbi:Lipase member M [Monoraphidium neglectum]|uniref:Lipase member M n=1 Tax=Monoraphidium neglectum TaxID=145388 RepID=A0A0D2L5L2_9CHLO|nr:Lipase member M [Monoraphidium neglectum]KIZ02314.1 Lipase member M [Monoraphidium neglectum]|eukprot:XP_013901333.1 Lipase member M [Monoraphidium neglectum]